MFSNNIQREKYLQYLNKAKFSNVYDFFIEIVSHSQDYTLDNLVSGKAKKTVGKTILETGHSIKPDEKICRLRETLGLPHLPPTTLSYKKALEQVNIITEKTGLKRIIEE